MKKITLLLLVMALSLFGQKMNFEFSLVYSQNNQELRTKLDDFTKKLKENLVSYDWEFPLTDFENIDNSIYIILKEESSTFNFKGMITVSSGIKQSGNTRMLQKRDVLFKENTLDMRIGYNDEPDLSNSDINSVENIIKFYVYCLLLENFDRLSYTDNENFYLYGEKYVNKLTALTARATGSDAIEYWKNRKKTADDYQNGTKNEERKLNALVYNAKHFINNFQPERTAYFIPHIYNSLEQLDKDAKIAFFNTYSIELAEIFKSGKDRSYLEKLKIMDPAHAKQYGK